MALEYKDSTGNYALDQVYDNKFPTGSKVQVRSGAAAGANNAAGGSLLVEYTVPGWGAAAAKSKAMSGLPLTENATAAGVAGHVRMKNAADTEREEGTCTATGGGGDWTINNVTISSGQAIQLTGVTRTA